MLDNLPRSIYLLKQRNRVKYNTGEFLVSRRGRFVALFRAYFDESGTDEDSLILVVGGAVGEISSWQSISGDWKGVLSRYDLEAFHSSEYNTGHGEFTGWEDKRRHGLINDLLVVIESHNLRAIAYVMDKRDYELVAKTFPRKQLSPYQFLSYACAIQTGRLTKVDDNIEPIEIVFEAGQKFYTYAMNELIIRLGSESNKEITGISAITVQSKKGIVPFQVADLIVYELLKAHLRIIRKDPLDPRYQATALNKIMRGFAPKLSTETIKSFLSAFND